MNNYIKILFFISLILFSYFTFTTPQSTYAQTRSPAPSSDPNSIGGCIGPAGNCDCSSPYIKNANLNGCPLQSSGFIGRNSSNGEFHLTPRADFTGECHIQLEPRGTCTITGGPSTVEAGGGAKFTFSQNTSGCGGNNCGGAACSIRFTVVPKVQPTAPPAPNPVPSLSVISNTCTSNAPTVRFQFASNQGGTQAFHLDKNGTYIGSASPSNPNLDISMGEGETANFTARVQTSSGTYGGSNTVTVTGAACQRYSISGQVFFDNNRNGMQDVTDDRVCRGTVYLQNPNGTTVAQYEIGPEAPNQFNFPNFMYTNYKLLVPTPTGYIATTPSFYDFLLNGNKTYNFGVAQPPTTTLTGRIFNDRNRDGVFNGSDSGLADERVQLINSFGNPSAEALTNSNGDYTISFISQANYTVRHAREPLWANWIRTTPRDVAVSMTENRSVSFGMTENTTTLSGMVYADNNKNGIFDSGDSRLWLEPIQLISSGTVVASRQTDSNGNYLIDSITPGTYQVKHNRLPNGYIRTNPPGDTVTVDLNSNQVVNFGYVANPPPSQPTIQPVTAKWCNDITPQTLVRWNASTNTTSYTIIRSDAGGKETILGTINQGSPLEWTDTPPENNQYYWYSVLATGPGGNTRSASEYAGASANCVAPTINDSSSQCTPYGIRFSWSTSTKNLSSFQIDRMLNGNASSWTTIASNINPAIREYTDSSVVPTNTYTYVIRSYGVENQSSPNSNVSGNRQAQYCDFNPPTLNWSPLSLNRPDPNGCFDDVMAWPRAMEVTIVDNPPPSTPPPSGVNPATVQVMLLNTTTGETVIPWTAISPINSNTWNFSLGRAYLARNMSFRISTRATDNAGNTRVLPYNFRFMASCWDWIQTRQGNVHSEGNINVPGGP